MTAPATPERSLDQRMTALRHANEIRTARAQLKRDIRTGRRFASEVLLEPPEYAATMKIAELLLCVPSLGVVKVSSVLRTVGVSPSKTLAGLTVRQRSELVGVVAARRSDRLRTVVPG